MALEISTQMLIFTCGNFGNSLTLSSQAN